MSLNWKEIDLILDELQLEKAFIQRVSQIAYNTIILSLYQVRNPRNILLSTHQGFVRIHETGAAAPGPIKHQRFAQLLRSRIKNGKISAVEQIHSQRIVRFSIQNSRTLHYLYFKMWNNGSNILLTDQEHRILDALYRRPNRNEHSGMIYHPEESYRGSEVPNSLVIRDYRPYPRLVDAVVEEFGERERGILLKQKKDKYRRQIERELQRLEQSLDGKQRALEHTENAPKYRHWGDLILSTIHLIRQNASSVTVEDYSEGNIRTEIPLNPQKKAQENAQDFYRKAKKIESSHRYILQDIENFRGRQERYRALLSQLEAVPALEDLEPFSFLDSKKAGEEPKKDGGLLFESNGFQLLAGRNARENDYLLRHRVKGNDLWLHTRDYPGGYVFIKNQKGKSVPLEVLLDAENLALFFSKGKNNQRADLYYTEVKHLRRAKGKTLGTVIPSQDRNLEIQKDQGRLDRMLGRASQGE